MTNKSVQRRLRIIFLFIISIRLDAWEILNGLSDHDRLIIILQNIYCMRYHVHKSSFSLGIVRVPTTPGCVILEEHTQIIAYGTGPKLRISSRTCELAILTKLWAYTSTRTPNWSLNVPMCVTFIEKSVSYSFTVRRLITWIKISFHPIHSIQFIPKGSKQASKSMNHETKSK